MRLALVQMYCPWAQRESTLARMEQYCIEAESSGAELVLFPELTVGGIYKRPEVSEFAEDADGTSVKFVSDVSRSLGIAIGFGFSERAKPLPRNAYCIVDAAGDVVAVYRKNFIPKLEVPYWQAGTERPVFKLLGRRMAIAICWDTTQRELLTDYSSRGVEILLMPHAWDSDPLDSEGKELAYDSVDELIAIERNGNLGWWKSYDQMRNYFLDYIPASAREFGFNACFINQTGQPHNCIKFVGPAFAVNKYGDLLAESDGEREQIVYVDIE